MSIDIQLRGEDVRRVQLAAAIGAVGVVGAALDPFATVFSRELVDVMSVTTGGDVDHIDVETVVRSFADVSAWLEAMHDAYGLTLSTSMTIEALALRFGQDHATVSVCEWREHSNPGLSVGFFGDLAAADVMEALRIAGVPSDSLLAWDTLLGQLPSRDIASLHVSLDVPTADPVFFIDLATPVNKADVEDASLRVNAAMQTLGVSDGQRGWQRATFKAMAGRDHNSFVIRTQLSRGGLHNTLRMSYPQIPARLAMKLLLQFTQVRDVPQRLGALAAAAGGGEDVVGALHVTAWDQEPPRVDVQWFKRGMAV